MVKVIENLIEFQKVCNAARRSGSRVGLVPTMGGLHEGHYSLFDIARDKADFVVASLFVNPIQFGEGEDFQRYPRTFQADIDGCEARGVHVVFAPDKQTMYPEGFQSRVLVDRVTEPFEGKCRPDFFEGVTTVVLKLINLTGPCVMMLGRKDYQQWKTLERMVLDLNMPVEVIGCPIIREENGLAMSTRNRYLKDNEHAKALGIIAGFRAAHDAWDSGERDAQRLRDLAAKPVEENFDRIDYVDIADPDTLDPPQPNASRLLVVVAAFLGKTRLIDNTVLGEGPRP